MLFGRVRTTLCVAFLLALTVVVERAAASEVLTVASSLSDFDSTRIVRCPPGETSSPDATNPAACLCAPRFTRINNTCVPCQSGVYKETVSDTACVSCPLHASSLPGSLTLADCLCDSGHTANATLCDPCVHNTYKTHVGSVSCRPCPGNASQALDMLGATALAFCQCDAGYSGPDGGPCEACGANFFKPAAGAHASTQCHAHSVSPLASTISAQCVCDLGFSSANSAQCAACEEGTFKNTTCNQACTACVANTVTVSPNVNPNDPIAPPATALSGCICGPGFFGPLGGPCALCEAGFFCQGFLDCGSATACYNNNSLSVVGSTDDSDCICLPGYWLALSMLCSTCSLNQYCAGDNFMYACPSNSTAPALSTNETDCTCDSGFALE